MLDVLAAQDKRSDESQISRKTGSDAVIGDAICAARAPAAPYVGRAFRMRVADLVIDVEHLHQEVRQLCLDYLVDDGLRASGSHRAIRNAYGAEPSSSAAQSVPADISVTVSRVNIEAERVLTTDGRPWPDAYLETLAVLRAIACQLPKHRRLLAHGAVIRYDGRAYLFVAPSGTGKSTHIMLWRQYLGEDVCVINGDKPFLLVPEASDVPAIAYGTPWAGKECWQENTCAPLAGIVLLSRSEPGASSCGRVEAAACLDKLMKQVYFPDAATRAAKTLELLDALLSRTPLYDLACDMTEDAVRVSFEAIMGKPYQPAL